MFVAVQTCPGARFNVTSEGWPRNGKGFSGVCSLLAQIEMFALALGLGSLKSQHSSVGQVVS